ncbi:hypothetical protein B6S12_03070 [Helicobacter valdiviensis]|uniref:Radical SAM protein n=1 Tax=Helicobacter valdiviensis TaxID=1458358 RepID=A0A2W6MXH7_9HELI|nr:radical SAM/SPASM domain-containing protein [Helicobacter valdiviensis]PZT48631.1 hypothetical protein B6S12_03070 [Helicobacter valdiviensis]
MSGNNEGYIIDKLRASNSIAGGGGFPSFIQLETVNGCTARCVMCGIDEWSKKMNSNYMEDALFYKIADEIIENKESVNKVSLYVGNEPLMDKKIASRIAYFKENTIKVNFSSNASLMNEKRAKEILDSKIDHINFSVDGLDKGLYEKIRKGLKFTEVLGNVLKFIQIRDKYNYETSVRISVIKHKAYEKDMQYICNFWSKILDLKKGDSIRIDGLNNSISVGNNRSSEISLECAKLPCYVLWNTITIKTDGSIALCCVDQCRTFKLGDLHKTTIKENWNNNAIRENIKQLHLQKGRMGVDVCKNCIAWL